MAEKRIKNKEVKIRTTDDIYIALSIHVQKNKTTRTKIIEDFLKDLLKEELQNIRKD
jgi:hypothetical protein